jgi:type IV pilus assembly protein PilN
LIKINLLSEGKRPAAVRRTRPASFLESENIALWALLAGLLLIGALPAAAWWWTTDRQVAANDVGIAERQREVEELAAIIAEVEEFKAKQAELEHRIEVIEQLRRNQRGPVQVMDQISRALPELLWLDRMEMRGGAITLSGRAFNSNAVASFLENLDRVPEFQEPSLRDLQEGSGGVYGFSIGFGFAFAPPEVETDAADGEAVADDGGTDAAAAPVEG